MRYRLSTALVAVLAMPTAPLLAQWTSSRVDGHAPIGVMADHRHEAGEVMLSVRYMPMQMQGSRIGTTAVADADIVSPAGQNFMVTPVEMSMTMIMGGLMWAPSDRLTLMAMVPYLDNSMDHITRAGGAFTTSSSGIGDISASALVGLGAWGNQSAHLNLGVSLPTGSITAMDVLPTSNGNAVQLPYPMQLGSGTYDLRPGITWLGQARGWSWGVQGLGTIRLGENDRGWTLGNRMDGTTWVGLPLARDVSVSVRGALASWGDIEGTDAAASVNPMVVPTARTDLRGGTRFDAGLGLNWYVHRRSGLRLAAEVLKPVYQDLHGPQLETDYTIVVGVQLVPVH
jgi:hypothetical protein